jgi:hypothetical protein
MWGVAPDATVGAKWVAFRGDASVGPFLCVKGGLDCPQLHDEVVCSVRLGVGHCDLAAGLRSPSFLFGLGPLVLVEASGLMGSSSLSYQGPVVLSEASGLRRSSVLFGLGSGATLNCCSQWCGCIELSGPEGCWQWAGQCCHCLCGAVPCRPFGHFLAWFTRLQPMWLSHCDQCPGFPFQFFRWGECSPPP